MGPPNKYLGTKKRICGACRIFGTTVKDQTICWVFQSPKLNVNGLKVGVGQGLISIEKHTYLI